jgi:RimJ/RimL family protein N-acetyltransferase
MQGQLAGDGRRNPGVGALAIPVLETARLRLRSLRVSDHDDYAALYADREVLRYLVGGGQEPWDRGRAWRHMAFLLGHWQFVGAGVWAVEHRETGAFVGTVGFAAPEGWPGFELAWALARRFWGHGYATEGAKAALAHAFTSLEKDRVISLIHPENLASIRVAERIGERPQGRVDHQGIEMLCYGLDRETYLREVAPARLGADTTSHDDSGGP